MVGRGLAPSYHNTSVASRLTLVVVIRGTMCAEVQFTFRVAIIVIATVTAKPIFLNGGCHLFIVRVPFIWLPPLLLRALRCCKIAHTVWLQLKANFAFVRSAIATRLELPALVTVNIFAIAFVSSTEEFSNLVIHCIRWVAGAPSRTLPQRLCIRML